MAKNSGQAASAIKPVDECCKLSSNAKEENENSSKKTLQQSSDETRLLIYENFYLQPLTSKEKESISAFARTKNDANSCSSGRNNLYNARNLTNLLLHYVGNLHAWWHYYYLNVFVCVCERRQR